MKLMKGGLDDGWASLCCAATRRKTPRHNSAPAMLQGKAFAPKGDESLPLPQSARRGSSMSPARPGGAPARPGGAPARPSGVSGKLKGILPGLGHELKGLLPGLGRASSGRASTRRASREPPAAQDAGPGAIGHHTPYEAAIHRV